MLNLKDKNVLILGGSGLIGSEVVKQLNKLGTNIFILDIKKPKLNTSNNKKIKFFKFDMTKKLFEENFMNILSKIKIIDCFINCAYPYSEDWHKSDFEKLTLTSLKKNLNFQLENSIWLTHIMSKLMIKKKINGSIVLLNSIYGLQGNDLTIYKNTQMRENITYSLIKGGISNYIRTMCPVLSSKGIRINSVCAGGVLGPVAGRSKTQSKIFLRNYSNKVPIKRLANAKEIASPVIFLCSSMSSYITGTNLIVDGGWTAI